MSKERRRDGEHGYSFTVSGAEMVRGTLPFCTLFTVYSITFASSCNVYLYTFPSSRSVYPYIFTSCLAYLG